MALGGQESPVRPTSSPERGDAMPTLVTFDDLVEGSVFWGQEVIAEPDAMVAYAKKYDPWPFHVDPEAAKQTSFGGLIASAGYTFSLWCQSFHTIFRTPDTEWTFLGGYELHIRLLQPVRPHDRLRLKLTVGRKRLSSRGGRGHVESLHELMRQEEVPVFSVELALLMATRQPV
jgi:acyl dehydratase